MRKVFNFVLGSILGALVGVTVATLLAPEAGETTRGQIQLRVQEIIDEGKRAASERRSELESQLEQLKRGEPLPPE